MASRSASFDPLSPDIIVADDHRALKITLFPRRLLPGLLWWCVGLLILVVALATLARPGEEALARVLALACSAGFAVFYVHVPSRATFELDARGLRFEARPRAATSPLDLALAELEGFRVLTQGRLACVAILARPGELHLVQALRMKRVHADALAAMLQRRLDELRAAADDADDADDAGDP